MDEGSNAHFFWRSLRRRWVVILGALLLGITAGSLLVSTSTAEYRATSVVFLEPLVGNPYSPTTPSGRQEQLAALTTEAGLLLADSVSQAALDAAQQAGVNLGPEIQERTSTEVPSNSQVIHVSFTASSPQAAQFGAQALATSYLDYRQSRSQNVLTAQLTRIDQEIESLTTLADAPSQELNRLGALDTDASLAEIRNLEEQVRIYANQLAQLRIERVNVEGDAGSPGEIVSPARLPAQPEGLPVPLLAFVVTHLFLAAGILGAVVLEHLDSRLRSRDEVEQLGLHPVYGPVPQWSPELAGSPAEDSYRMAALPAQRGIHAVLGADGANPGEVAAGLVRALADIGHSVLVVQVAPTLEAEGHEHGLSDVLEYDKYGEEGLLEVDEHIRLLGPGQHAEDLPDLVQGHRFPALVRRLAQQCDTLILVGAEARSATGAALAHVSHSTLLVCIAGQTREDDLQSAASLVRESGGQLNGVFLAMKAKRKRRRVDSAAGLGGGLAALLTQAVATTGAEPTLAEPAPPRHRSDRLTAS